tara:strand:- start:1715 stop:1936 length:222 start_codon:yes stop_codon:yes gene_type:complete
MRKLDIKYVHGSSWVGSYHELIVNSKTHALRCGPWRCDGKFGDEYHHAILILKLEYGIVKTKNEINFEWDGNI